MWQMRPAATGDQDGIRALVLARSAWLEDRGLPSWRESADAVASQAGSEFMPMWVLTMGDGQLIGCTTLFDATPALGWTEEERAESAFFLATSCTDPSFRVDRPGELMAHWAVDKAARENRAWVRRGCVYEGLAANNLAQGFHLVRTVRESGMDLRLMARRAELLPHLDTVVREVLPASGG